MHLPVRAGSSSRADDRGIRSKVWHRSESTNDAYVLADEDTDALDVLGQATRRSWADRPAVEIQLELEAQTRQLELDRGGPSLGR